MWHWENRIVRKLAAKELNIRLTLYIIINNMCWPTSMTQNTGCKFMQVWQTDNMDKGTQFDTTSDQYGVVIVYGQVTECHLTFVRDQLYIVSLDPRIDHKSSSIMIVSVPWLIPVREVYFESRVVLRMKPPYEEQEAQFAYILHTEYVCFDKFVSRTRKITQPAFFLSDFLLLYAKNETADVFKELFPVQGNSFWFWSPIVVCKEGSCDVFYGRILTKSMYISQ